MAKPNEENSTYAKDAPSIKIYIGFDLDYLEDYEALPRIFEAIGNTPATFFLAGSRHPEEPIEFPTTCEIGNHSFMHEEWYGLELKYRFDDLMVNHDWLKKTYRIESKVYRSPHLRNFEDTKEAMVKAGYLPEMECAECPWCPPMTHSHLKVYFSSHHHFGPNPCHRSFNEAFELICQKGKDFTFFLDPHHFDTDDKLEELKHLINTGKDYGEFRLLSNQK